MIYKPHSPGWLTCYASGWATDADVSVNVRFREQLSMSMRVMGGRDIKIAAALFAFYHEVSHLVVFHSFQNAGFALAT